jgi:hypothetical protein
MKEREKNSNKKPKKKYHRFWGLAKRLEYRRVKGKENKKK